MQYGKKILLVEDDHFTRFMMKEMIDTLDIDVEFALNGEDGCKMVQENPVDYALILMDIHMPKLSGTDATKAIRSSPKDPPRNIPIYAVTADEQYHDQTYVSSLGMNGFIAKPITAGDLNRLVEQYCTA